MAEYKVEETYEIDGYEMADLFRDDTYENNAKFLETMLSGKYPMDDKEKMRVAHDIVTFNKHFNIDYAGGTIIALFDALADLVETNDGCRAESEALGYYETLKNYLEFKKGE